ncbi:MAG: DUF3887 domain-containing protein [Anaerolineae bacterium]|nr:MAG: DUF3887 domain-containing protein [Anaerolineae bacterium]
MLSLGLLAGLLLTSCNAAPPAVTLTGSEREAFLAYSEPMVDNLFQGMNAGDYDQFARDFDTAMAKAMPASSFDQFMASIGSKLGRYESRTVSTVEAVGDFTRVAYQARFANDDPVTVRIAFHKDTADHLISGLWFDSAKLRGQ